MQSGHIIEFHNGTFDLPLPPKPKEELAPKPAAAQKSSAAPESNPVAGPSVAAGTPEAEPPTISEPTVGEAVEDSVSSTEETNAGDPVEGDAPVAHSAAESIERPADSVLP